MKGVFIAESRDIQNKYFFLKCWTEDASQAGDFPMLPAEREPSPPQDALTQGYTNRVQLSTQVFHTKYQIIK